MTLSDAVDVLGVGVLGVVYYDDAISEGNNRGIPVTHENKNISSKCFFNISKRINGESVPLLKYKKRSLLEKLFN